MIKKNTEAISDALFSGAMFMVMFALMLIAIFVVGVMVYGLTHQEFDYSCAYCQNAISEHADTVICTDGRRYNAECYLRYIEEGDNGKVEN